MRTITATGNENTARMAIKAAWFSFWWKGTCVHVVHYLLYITSYQTSRRHIPETDVVMCFFIQPFLEEEIEFESSSRLHSFLLFCLSVLLSLCRNSSAEFFIFLYIELCLSFICYHVLFLLCMYRQILTYAYVIPLSFDYLVRLLTSVENFIPFANVLLIFWFYNSLGTVIRWQTLNFLFLFYLSL